MIIAGKWVLPVTSPPISEGAVLVRNGTIVEVGKKEELVSRYSQEKLLDFQDSIVLPGFIDAHTHLEYSPFRGVVADLPFWNWKLEITKLSPRLSESDWEGSAELGVLEAVRAGITAIGDITRTGASLRASLRAGLRGCIFLEVSGMDHRQTGKIMEEMAKRLESWRAEAKNSLISLGVSPYSVYNSCPLLLKEVAEFSREEKVLFAIHLAGSREEYEFVKYGSGPLAHQYRKLMGWGEFLWQPTGVSPVRYVENWRVLSPSTIAIHCVQVSEEDIEILRRYGVRIVHCPRTSSKLGMGITPLWSFLKRGFMAGLGTDSPASNYTNDFFDEMRVSLLLQRGLAAEVKSLTAEKFVEMATLGGARVLGMDDQVGSLEVGKKADIIAVDISEAHEAFGRDPFALLVYWANQDNVRMTMVEGKILYQDGNFYTLNYEEIVKKTRSIKEKLQA